MEIFLLISIIIIWVIIFFGLSYIDSEIEKLEDYYWSIEEEISGLSSKIRNNSFDILDLQESLYENNGDYKY